MDGCRRQAVRFALVALASITGVIAVAGHVAMFGGLR